MVLEAPIARGTLGTLWRGRDALGRPVALKRIPVYGDVELIGLLETDGARLAALDQPGSDSAGLVAWSVVVDGLCVMLVMDLVSRGSWADRLSGGSARGSGEVTGVGASIARCLARIHAEGLVHGDLKASAVLFDGPPEADARVRLGDAGLATRFAATDRFGPFAHATVGRLDPSVAAGHPFSPASDVFALGVLCAEMLLGGLPSSQSGAHTPAQPARSLPRDLARLRETAPKGLLVAVREALAPSPESRPTAAELAVALVEASPGPLRHASTQSTLRSAPPLTQGPVLGAEETGTVPASAVLDLPSTDDTPTSEPPGPRPLRPALTPRQGDALRPGPPNPPSSRSRGRLRRVAAWCSVATVAILLVEGLWRAAVGSDHSVQRARPPAVSCRGAGNDGFPAGGRLVGHADVTGRGCLSPVVQVGQELEVQGAPGRRGPVLRFRPAVPGGRVVIGDFGCGRRATPALYDPRTGEVFVYLHWPEPGRPASATRTVRSGVTEGRPVVRRREGTTCSFVQVLPPSGHTGTGHPAAAQGPTGGEAPEPAGG